MEYEIRIFETDNGKRPFSEWLNNLRDIQAKAKIRLRLDRLAMGNFGDCKSVKEGVSELKIGFGLDTAFILEELASNVFFFLLEVQRTASKKILKRLKNI